MNPLVMAIRPGMANTSVTVMDMEGTLDISTAPDFESMLHEFNKKKRYKIVLNMKKLDYISSDGFGAIMGVIKEVRENKGDIKFANLSPEVYEVFQMLELSNLFQILKTEDEAVRAF